MSQHIVLSIALVNFAEIWSTPGDLCLFSFVLWQHFKQLRNYASVYLL